MLTQISASASHPLRHVPTAHYNGHDGHDGHKESRSHTIGPMRSGVQSILHVALVVRDYDEAIAFYCGKLGFTLVEDTYQPSQDKRWVVVSPPGSSGTSLLLARASNDEQARFVGNQAGGRVFLFLKTDDFWRDYERLRGQGIVVVREPKTEPYGTVAVFEDLYGNRWDLIELSGEPR